MPSLGCCVRGESHRLALAGTGCVGGRPDRMLVGDHIVCAWEQVGEPEEEVGAGVARGTAGSLHSDSGSQHGER